MMKKPFRSLILLGAGEGTRFESATPKQLSRIGGESIFELSLKQILKVDLIDEIVIVTSEECLSEVNAITAKYLSERKIIVVIGGRSRQESSYLGCEALSKESDFVAVHEAVRPFISPEIITSGYELLMNPEIDGVDTVIATSDTIVQLDEAEKFIQTIPNRKQLRRGQTPQFFPTKLLKKVYSLVEHHELSTFNDECGLVLRVMPNARIATIDGSERNLKITTQQDSLIAEQLLRTPSLLSAGNFEELDNPEVKCLIIIGGESGIGKAVKEISVRAGVEVISLSRRNGYDINLQTGRDAIATILLREKHKECHLVITAGILELRALKELNIDHLEKIFTTNLLSPALLIGELANLDSLPNSITLVGSTSYLKSRHSMFAYSASKSGLISLLHSFIDELGGSGTRINVIVPERTNTEMRQINFNDSDKTQLVAEEVALGILECVAMPINGQIIQIRSRR